jgi:hypothetical protein
MRWNELPGISTRTEYDAKMPGRVQAILKIRFTNQNRASVEVPALLNAMI